MVLTTKEVPPPQIRLQSLSPRAISLRLRAWWWKNAPQHLNWWFPFCIWYQTSVRSALYRTSTSIWYHNERRDCSQISQLTHYPNITWRFIQSDWTHWAQNHQQVLSSIEKHWEQTETSGQNENGSHPFQVFPIGPGPNWLIYKVKNNLPPFHIKNGLSNIFYMRKSLTNRPFWTDQLGVERGNLKFKSEVKFGLNKIGSFSGTYSVSRY
jgi:hypothetical protein